jgi:hypothetical protein
MIDSLNRMLLQNASGVRALMMFVLAIAALTFMGAVITPAFQDATGGLRPFDLNLEITAEQMYRDLPAYTDRSRRLYLGFAIVDYIYPAAAALFFAMLWAWMFKKWPGRAFDLLQRYGIFLLPFIYMLIDWSENAGFLYIVFSYPEQHYGIADLASALKGSKSNFLYFNFFLTLVFAGKAITLAIANRRRRER